MTKSVCIVSHEIVGPHKNGGVGTHVYHLAVELARGGFDVTVLFTGVCENESNLYWVDFYKHLKIKYVAIEELEMDNYDDIYHDWFINNSYTVYQYLLKNKYDYVHFQELCANGFHTIQAKKSSKEFLNTVLTVTMHSSTQWVGQGMNKWNNYPLSDTKLWWCERYCCENADILISPSYHMFNWAIANGWQLSENRFVIPYCYTIDKTNTVNNKALDFSHLIFFGRLETRKGLELFCNAVSEIVKETKNTIQKVSFLGKIGQVGENTADKYIKEKLSNVDIDFAIYNNFNPFEAMKFIKSQNGIAVIPSLLDNYPYVLIECIENDVNFITSDIGGIPEMVDEKVLFGGSVTSLKEKIYNLENTFKERLSHKYSKKIAKDKWTELHGLDFKVNSADKTMAHKKPLVSLCIEHRDFHMGLSKLLDSISRNSYDNYEVIIVSDNSNDIFESAKASYNYSNWKFYKKQHDDKTHARNLAARYSNGEYLMFIDANSKLEENAIEDFVYALANLQADCAVSHFNAVIKDSTDSNGENEVEYLQMPIGACVEVGCMENTFGDTNFIIKKDVFMALKGFDENINSTRYMDWGIMAQLSLAGYRQVVIPKPLYKRLMLSKKDSEIESNIKDHRNILNIYYNYSNPYTRYLLEAFVLPEYNNTIVKNNYKNKLYQIASKLLENGIKPDIIIYGAGRAGRQLIRLLKKYGVNIKCAVDKNESLWGSYIENIEVCSFEKALNYNVHNYAIGSFAFIDEIKDTIEKKYEYSNTKPVIFYAM